MVISQIHDHVQQADLTLVLIGLAAGGLAFLAGKLLQKSITGTGGLKSDSTPTTLSQHGDFIHYISGKRTAGHFFAWADDEGRFTREETIGSSSSSSISGFGGGSSASAKQTVHFMAGWHILNLGPGTSLTLIQENDKIIWEGLITRTSSPSGTMIEIAGVGSFKIYWGEVDQPIDELLASRTGIRSRWPGFMHIVWYEKRLGTSPTWGQLDYTRSVEYDCVGGVAGSYVLDDGQSRGINPAHLLVQYLTGKHGFGAGLAPQLINKTAIDGLSALFEDEHLPYNMLIEEGQDVETTIQAMLEDLGVMMPEYDSMLTFISMRASEDTVPNLTEDVIIPPKSENKIQSRTKKLSRIFYTYKNEALYYSEDDVKFDNDGLARVSGTYKTQTIPIVGATHEDVANKIANRKVQTAFVDLAGFNLKASRAANMLLPGQSITIDGLGQVLVMANTPSVNEPGASLQCVRDTYSVPQDVLLVDTRPTIPAARTAEADIDFTFFELPPDLASTNMPEIVVFRIRAHQQISGAEIWISADNIAYQSIGAQNTSAVGGPALSEDLPATGPDFVENGPIFEHAGHPGDVSDILDLSSNLPAFQAGDQIMVWDEEAFYVRELEVQSETTWAAVESINTGDVRIPSTYTGYRYVAQNSGTSGASEPSWGTVRGQDTDDNGISWRAQGYRYQAKGLIRARLGTEKQAHTGVAGNTVYVQRRSSLSVMSAGILQAGQEIWLKTQPFSFSGPFDLPSVTAVVKTIMGYGNAEIYIMDHDGDFLVTHIGDRLVL